MIENDMNLKMQHGMEKVHCAIKEWNGCTLLSTGITGDDARLAKAAVEAGARMLEPNHPAVCLARGHKGVSTMHEAEKVRHEITVAQMAEVTRGIRNVVRDNIYITVGIPGGFTELKPFILTDEHMQMMSDAGADGLHTHKSSFKDLEDLVNLAHKYGLLVDAYIGKKSDRHIFGLPADSPEEVAHTARLMESIGTDMIGIMSGMSYDGVKAGEIPSKIQERIIALKEAVKVPTLAEGGINITNYKAFKKTGVDIIVVGTSFDQVAQSAVQSVMTEYKNGVCNFE